MDKKSIMNKRIEIPHEKSIKLLFVSIMIYYWGLYLCDYEAHIKSLFWTRVYTVGIEVFLTIIVVILFRWLGEYKESLFVKDKKQYITGVLLLVPDCIVISIIIGRPIFQGFRGLLTIDSYITLFFVYVIVAVTEELVFRVLIQGELVIILGKAKCFAPIISAIIFGIVHWPQGELITVKIAFCSGLLLGYSKMYLKHCTFISVVLEHFLYDFIVGVIL